MRASITQQSPQENIVRTPKLEDIQFVDVHSQEEVDTALSQNKENFRFTGDPSNLAQWIRNSPHTPLCPLRLFITSVTKEIPENCFQACALRNVWIRNVRIIQHNAFEKCTLESIDLDETVKTLGSYAFAHCSKLADIDLSHVEKIETACFFDSALPEITCPDLKEVGKEAFSHCENLKSVSVPLLKTLPAYIFSSCPQLESVECPEVINVQKKAFHKCKQLNHVSADHLQRIEEAAFFCCEKFNPKNFPQLKFIGTEAFAGAGIEKFECLEGIIIENDAFTGSRLKYFAFPSDLTNIDTRIFGSDERPFGNKIRISIPQYCKLSQSTITNKQDIFGQRKTDPGPEEIKEKRHMSLPVDVRIDVNSRTLEMVITQIPNHAEPPQNQQRFEFSGPTLKNILIQHHNLEANECVPYLPLRGKIIKIEPGYQRIPDYWNSFSEETKKVILPETMKQIGDNAFLCNKIKICIPSIIKDKDGTYLEINTQQDEDTLQISALPTLNNDLNTIIELAYPSTTKVLKLSGSIPPYL